MEYINLLNGLYLDIHDTYLNGNNMFLNSFFFYETLINYLMFDRFTDAHKRDLHIHL